MAHPFLKPLLKHRVVQGDTFAMDQISSVAGEAIAQITVTYEDGSDDEFIVKNTHAGDRLTQAVIGTEGNKKATQSGYVTSLRCVTTNASTARGQHYVQVFTFGRGTVRDLLAKGYLYSTVYLGLDDFVEPGPKGGPGFRNVVSLGDPAAGATFATQTVPTNTLWKPRGFAASLVTDVTAVNREVQFTEDDGANIYAGWSVDSTQAASVTNVYRGAIGGPLTAGTTGIGGTLQAPLAIPDIEMPAAHRIVFTTASLQAGDNWGAGFLIVEEWVGPSIF